MSANVNVSSNDLWRMHLDLIFGMFILMLFIYGCVTWSKQCHIDVAMIVRDVHHILFTSFWIMWKYWFPLSDKRWYGKGNFDMVSLKYSLHVHFDIVLQVLLFMPPAWKVCQGHLVIGSFICLSLVLSRCSRTLRKTVNWDTTKYQNSGLPKKAWVACKTKRFATKNNVTLTQKSVTTRQTLSKPKN